MTTTPPPGGPPLLEWLFAHDAIRLERAARLDTTPRPPAREGLADRVEGMLLGLAIGDSLGNTSESQRPLDRFARYGEIRDYLPNRWAGGRPVGTPSDDSQLAVWLVEHLLATDGRLEPATLADIFASRPIFGAGTTMRQFLAGFRSGMAWWKAAPESAGNGAVMRIAPVVLPHLRSPSSGLWVDAALAARLTHDDRASTAACVAWVAVLWECLAAPGPRAEGWWLDAFTAWSRDLEGSTCYRSRVPGDGFEGPMTRYVLRAHDALAQGLTAREACDGWHSGAYVLETMASALFILARHGADPEEALVRAVNDTWDNDTVAALVGAAMGALHGRSALPARWRDGLLGRTGADDDGRIQELVRHAVERFA